MTIWLPSSGSRTGKVKVPALEKTGTCKLSEGSSMNPPAWRSSVSVTYELSLYRNTATTTNYGNATTPTNIPSGTTAVAIAQAINVSPPGQTNHLRIVATNSAGTAQGMDRRFAWSATSLRLTSFLLAIGGFELRFTGQSGQVY